MRRQFSWIEPSDWINKALQFTDFNIIDFIDTINQFPKTNPLEPTATENNQIETVSISSTALVLKIIGAVNTIQSKDSLIDTSVGISIKSISSILYTQNPSVDPLEYTLSEDSQDRCVNRIFFINQFSSMSSCNYATD